MKIAFVLPVHNAQTHVAQCINSLLHQTYKNTMLIIIDDNSTDNTNDILRAVKNLNNNNNLQIIFNSKREGAASCRNKGNNIAKNNGANIIAVCDADFYYKNRAEAIYQFFKTNKDKDVFYSSLHLRKSSNVFEKYLMDAYEWDFNSKCPISHPTVAYRINVAKKIKYKELSVDTDLYEFFLLDAHKNGFKFGGCQDSLMLKTEGNTKRDKKKASKLKFKLYKEYGVKNVNNK